MRLVFSLTIIANVYAYIRNPILGRLSRSPISATASTSSTLSAPITYTPIDILPPKGTKKSTLLVKSNEKDIISSIKQWIGKLDTDESKQLADWSAEGKVFWLNSEDGIESLVNAERRDSAKLNIIKKTKPISSNVDVYVDVSVVTSGGAPSRSKKSKGSSTTASYLVKASKVGQLISGSKDLRSLELSGDAFANVTELLTDYSITSRADYIATRVRNDFPIASPEWQRWTNKTNQYNATSLTQVVSEYFAGHSTGDIGGPDADYIAKRGYPGTLAPGENFLENNPFSELPKHILHPWPAMQEIQFHVRMPPNHPMLPPLPLWFGLNNMYTENYTNYQLNRASEETVGGMMILPKDAIRIARFHTIGACYEAEDQVEHGGMIFKTGKQIPFYHPDHGPTVSEEEAKPPVPEELLPITERWLDPFFGILSTTVRMPELSSALQEEVDEEEAMRIAAAERLVSMMPSYQARSAEAAEEERLDEEDAERRRDKRLKMLSGVEDEEQSDGEGDGVKVKEAVEPMLDRRAQRMQDKVIKGFARDPRTLITYSVETIRDLSEEITIAARRDDSNKKSGRRTKIQKKERRPATADFDADVVDAEVVGVAEFDGGIFTETGEPSTSSEGDDGDDLLL